MEPQYLEQAKPTQSAGSLFAHINVDSLRKKADDKIEYQFQDIGIEMENHFGKQYSKRIWPLFYSAKYTVDVIDRAWKSYKEQNRVKTFNYFMGILKKTK